RGSRRRDVPAGRSRVPRPSRARWRRAPESRPPAGEAWRTPEREAPGAGSRGGCVRRSLWRGHFMAAAGAEVKVHLFTVGATWSGDSQGCGTLQLPQGDLALPIGGSKMLGGCGLGANPEELMLG